MRDQLVHILVDAFQVGVNRDTDRFDGLIGIEPLGRGLADPAGSGSTLSVTSLTAPVIVATIA
jgi:hypothetical protein